MKLMLKSAIALVVLIGSMALVMFGLAAPVRGQTLAAEPGYQFYKLTNGMWEPAPKPLPFAFGAKRPPPTMCCAI